ncbi:saccharopine dehydrogenase-like oxidoreductase [Rhexocercosporidium sp. MPI-PUGE-AT-0058]|nr:saccharopine dehydrogenase-like oxidoreductase [Rhexocercosporidium sp. MPI-PUGE-AT-0058]
MANNILVLGAGELGTSILTALSKLSPPETKISVLLRPSTIKSTSPTKIGELAHLKNQNITFLPGDISSPISTLAQLFSPYDLIISCLGYASGPGSQIKITQAVLEANVKRYIPWQFGADYDVIGRGCAQPVWDEQLDVRDMLRAQRGTEWIIVSTGIFMSFLFEPFFGVVDLLGQGGDGTGNGEVVVRALGGWENKVSVTTPEDIGRLTAMIVLAEPKIRNEIVYVAGETVSYGRFADIVERVTGKKVKREVWSVDFLKRELAEDPENVIKRYRVIFGEGKGVSWDMERTFNRQRGIEVADVESFASGKLA